MSDLYAIAVSVNELARPGIKPQELIEAVRERHPDASKKQIVRGAFMAVIAHAEADPEKVARIHDFALLERGDDDDPRPSDTRTKRGGKKPKPKI